MERAGDALKPSSPPEIRVSEPTEDGVEDREGVEDGLKEDVRSGTRTPRPYARDGEEVLQDGNTHEEHDDGGHKQDQWTPRAAEGTTEGSESGTEADDEKFVKALPAPSLRPRKGLKTGEKNEEALLTPSQLDDEGRSGGYFTRVVTLEEEEKVFKRRRAEFMRRCSEVGLMSVVLGTVLCGPGVLAVAKQWWRELLAHGAVMVALVAAYPVKLSIVDTSTQSQARKIWERFRVPASFDPATVLYPPLLPLLVALSISPANGNVILPNMILGLASLPQRLFPRSSRLGGINVLHWFVSIVPLIVATRKATPLPTAATSPTAETLVSLYPLHHALLQPLHYLTTTSLLITELHLLSAALINLLLLASSPQMQILKACLWIGGLGIFVACGPVLRWSVTLIRVPRWKLRRPGHMAEERRSLVDAVTELISLQMAADAFSGSGKAENVFSDADEDEPKESIKQGGEKQRLNRLNTSCSAVVVDAGPISALEPPRSNGMLPERNKTRRNTLPSNAPQALLAKEAGIRRKSVRSSTLLWPLRLTRTQAERRKYIYATYIYALIALTILFPVRLYVSARALDGHEPVGWAVGYLLGQLEPARNIISTLGWETWIPLPSPPSKTWPTISFTLPSLRSQLGAAHTRLLLIAYWALVLLLGLLAVFALTAHVEVDTRRKVFHFTMVAMLLPSTFVDPCACALALALILAVFLLLEVIRAGQVPPVGRAIGRFVAPYVDGRDLRGPVVVSHIFLLIGCAVPLWFSLASLSRSGTRPWAGWELEGDGREVAMISGVVCVGMGDAAASLIGRRYGRHKWPWVGGKSLEGSAAFAVAVTIGLLAGKVWLVAGGWEDSPVAHIRGLDLAADWRGGGLVGWSGTVAKAAGVACGASFMEAVLTGANDNVVVPVVLWLLVKGLRV